MNVKIVLRKDKMNAHGLCPVVIQISEGKEVARIPLGFTLKAEDFDKETQTVLKQHSEHKNYNQNIQNAKNKIEIANREISQLEHVHFAIGLPKVSLFKELYFTEEGAIEFTLKKYANEYGVQIKEVIFPHTDRKSDLFRIPINYKIQPEKYDEAIALLRKFSKNESDPKIDELLASQVTEEEEEEQEKEALFSEAWEKYYKYCLREKAPNTSIRIPNNLKILKSFTASTNIPLTFESFTKEFGSVLKEYLILHHHNYITKKKGVSNGTVHNILKSISAFLNWAKEENYHESLQFKKWEKKKPKSDLQYLTEPQLKELFDYELPLGSSYDKTRDLWLFSAFSAMRWGDIEKWVPSNVTSEGLIKYRSEKVKKDCTVGLNNVTKSILKKYNGSLPIQNDSLANKNIKKILEKMGYDKTIVNRVLSMGTKDIVKQMPFSESITLHSARRSFINLMISKGCSIAHLSTMTGNEVKSLMVYYKDDDSQMKKVMEKMNLLI